MNNIKCVVSYNGTNYSGWQVQTNSNSIQEEIELALFKICKEKIKITGAGRTDSGVHSIGQTFNFKTNINMEPDKWKLALNSLLPLDIRITSSELVDEDFHSRFNAKGKIYRYLLNTNEFDPIHKDLIYQYTQKLDANKMQLASRLFLGKHDFRNFCSNSIEEVKDFTKEIEYFNIKDDNGLISFEVKGSGFLRYQVRMMVGTLIEIGSGKKDESIISSRLDKLEFNTTSYNAPSNGLYLMKVIY